MKNANRASELKENRTESNNQGDIIESSECLKLLGVTLDEQLNFNILMKYVRRRVKRLA